MRLKKSFCFLAVLIVLVGSSISTLAQDDADIAVRGAFLTTRPSSSSSSSTSRKSTSSTQPKSTTTNKQTAKSTSTSKQQKTTKKNSKQNSGQQTANNGTEPINPQPFGDSTMANGNSSTSSNSSNLTPLSNSFANSTYKPEAIGLGYTLYQNDGSGFPVRVDPLTEFRAKDQIRLVFEPNTDGYLYVFYTENDGPAQMLFPDARLRNGNNAVLAHVPYEVPSSLEPDEKLRWFVFDNKPATERIYVVVTRQPMQGVPTGDQLINYCKENAGKSGCTWKLTPDVWEKVKSSAESTNVGVSKSKSFGDRRTSGEEVATTRGLGLSQEAPPPSVIRMNSSTDNNLLVTRIDLIHK
jgi:hypothetical protein